MMPGWPLEALLLPCPRLHEAFSGRIREGPSRSLAIAGGCRGPTGTQTLGRCTGPCCVHARDKPGGAWQCRLQVRAPAALPTRLLASEGQSPSQSQSPCGSDAVLRISSKERAGGAAFPPGWAWGPWGCSGAAQTGRGRRVCPGAGRAVPAPPAGSGCDPDDGSGVCLEKRQRPCGCLRLHFIL